MATTQGLNAKGSLQFAVLHEQRLEHPTQGLGWCNVSLNLSMLDSEVCRWHHIMSMVPQAC
jgi:hypothetical protein